MPNTIEAELHRQYSAALQSLANDCRDDPDLRARVDEDPGSVFADRGLPFPEDTDVRVARNTAEVFHLTMPPDPNAHLSDEMLGGVAGGSHRHPNDRGPARHRQHGQHHPVLHRHVRLLDRPGRPGALTTDGGRTGGTSRQAGPGGSSRGAV